MVTKAILSGSSGAGLGKSVFARLEPGDDLIQGIKQVCRDNDISNGVILCCIGSLNQAVFTYGKVLKDPAAADIKENKISTDGPVSLDGCQGVICRQEPGGELSVHLHGTVMDNNGRVIAQDFDEMGNTVFNTVDLVIADLGVPIVRKKDPELPGLITKLDRE